MPQIISIKDYGDLRPADQDDIRDVRITSGGGIELAANYTGAAQYPLGTLRLGSYHRQKDGALATPANLSKLLFTFAYRNNDMESLVFLIRV